MILPHVHTKRRSIRTILGAALLLAALAASAGATELTVMHCWTGSRTALVDAMLAKFEETHPGVKVTGQLVSSCNEPLFEAFLTAYMGGVAPDVVMIRAWDIPAAAESGILIPMYPWFERDGLSESMWFPAEIESARWEADVYGLPIRTGGDANSLMFYNIDMLEQAGIGSVPQTWEELHAVSRRLVRYSGDQLVSAAMSPHGGDLASPAWLAAGGGMLYSADGKRVTFNEQEGLATLTWLYEHFSSLYRGGLVELDGTLGSSQARRRAAFINGQLAFNFDGSWNFTLIKDEAPDLRYGVALRPTSEEGGAPGVHGGTFHYAIPQGVQDPDLAWELVKWLTINEETAGNFMLVQDRPSPVIEFSRNRAYWERNPYWPVVIEGLMRVDTLPVYPFTYDVAVLFGDALRASMRGEQAPETALADAATRAQALIDEFWRGRD